MSHKKSESKISIVIPAHNEATRIALTLGALRHQTYPPDLIEIIVVDNNCTDETASIALSYGTRVVTERHPGVAWAREAGWRVAQGEIVLSTDADVQPSRFWVEDMMEKFVQHPEVVGITGGLRFYDKPKWFNALAAMMNPLLVFLGFLMSRGVYNFTGNNMAARRSAYEQVGGFNTNLRFGEDMDLARRLRKVGKIRFYPGLVMRVSGRRYTLNKAFWRYFLNYLWTSLFAKPKYNELPKVT